LIFLIFLNPFLFHSPFLYNTAWKKESKIYLKIYLNLEKSLRKNKIIRLKNPREISRIIFRKIAEGKKICYNWRSKNKREVKIWESI